MADINGNKTGGRTKGVPNKDTELKAWIKQVVADNREKAITELSKLHGKAYLDALFILLEYIQPKLSRIEVQAEIETNLIDLSQYKTEDIKKAIESHDGTIKG